MYTDYVVSQDRQTSLIRVETSLLRVKTYVVSQDRQTSCTTIFSIGARWADMQGREAGMNTHTPPAIPRRKRASKKSSMEAASVCMRAYRSSCNNSSVYLCIDRSSSSVSAVPPIFTCVCVCVCVCVCNAVYVCIHRTHFILCHCCPPPPPHTSPPDRASP